MFASEEKHRYNGVINTTTSTTPGYVDLTRASGQGEARENDVTLNAAQRDGYRIQPLSLSIAMQITVADATNLVRVVITKYKNLPPTGVPLITDFLYTGPSGVYTYVYATYERNNVPNRVEIVYDKRFQLDTYHPVKWMRWRKKYGFGPIKYSGDSYGDWTQNYYYMWTMSDSGTIAHPGLQGRWSFLFANI